MSNNFKLSSSYNFLRGEKNTNEPLAHIPPENFVLSLGVSIRKTSGRTVHEIQWVEKYR